MMRSTSGGASNAKRSGGFVPMSSVGMPKRFAGTICNRPNPTIAARTARLRSWESLGEGKGMDA